MSKVINITVPMNYKGQHYPGVTLFSGVGMSVEDVPCGGGKKMVAFTNTSMDVKPVMLDAIGCIDDSQDHPVPAYLKIKP